MTMRIRFSLLTLAVACAVGPAAAGDLDNAMLEAFNSTGNVTNPTAVMTPSRGVLSGGSVQARSEISNVDLFSVRPPSISGGCGGIDINGGAISFISSDELVNTAKNVASNAAYLLFQQAISNVSNRLAETIDKGIEKMNEWNIQAKSSCEIAESLLDAGMSSLNRSAQNANANNGGATDYLGAGGGNGQSPAAMAVAGNPQLAAALSKNYVWQALERQEVAGWLGVAGETSDALREQVMSITGSVVVCADPDKECGVRGAARTPAIDGLQNAQRAYVPGVLRFVDLVEGTQAGKAPIQVYRCVDADCLTVDLVTLTEWKTVSQQIREVMLGEDGNSGIIAEWKVGAGPGQARDPSPQELAVLHSAAPLVSAASELVATGQYLRARQLVDLMADRIAADLVQASVSRTFDLVEASMMVNDPTGSKPAMDALKDRRELVQQQYDAYVRLIDGRKATIDFLLALSNGAGARNRRIAGPEGSGLSPVQ